MNPHTVKIVSGFLADYGWNFKETSSGQIQSGWEGRDCNFPLQIHCYDSWVGFQVGLFPTLKIDWESWPEISRFLLEWNDSSHMAKISIDADGVIQLSIDVLTHNINYGAFSHALSILGHYSEAFYDDFLTFLDSIGFRYCESLNILT